jgi:hypothetical protein
VALVINGGGQTPQPSTSGVVKHESVRKDDLLQQLPMFAVPSPMYSRKRKNGLHEFNN